MDNFWTRLRYYSYIFLILATVFVGDHLFKKASDENSVLSVFNTTVVKPLKSFGDLILGTNTAKPEVALSAWIPEWGWDDGFNSFSKHSNSFSQINPVWYHVDEDGNLKPTKYAGSKKWQKRVKKRGVLFIPTIQSFDADYLHEVLKSKTEVIGHVSEILTVVDKYDLDGIDIDYEMIYLDDKKNFYLLLDILSQELHKRYKILAIDVIAKTEDSKEYESLTETRQVQDWTILAKYVDEIRIMAYDYAKSEPGGSPINPYFWLEDVVKYAIGKADPQKFVLGTPLYSYSWKNGEIFSSYTYDVIKEAIAKRDAIPIFDDNAKEWRVELVDIGDDEEEEDVAGITDENNEEDSENNLDDQQDSDEQSKEEDEEEEKIVDGTQIVWYQDVKSFKHRLNLVKYYNLKGLALWRLGGEDTRIYELFE